MEGRHSGSELKNPNVWNIWRQTLQHVQFTLRGVDAFRDWEKIKFCGGSLVTYRDVLLIDLFQPFFSWGKLKLTLFSLRLRANLRNWNRMIGLFEEQRRQEPWLPEKKFSFWFETLWQGACYFSARGMFISFDTRRIRCDTLSWYTVGFKHAPESGIGNIRLKGIIELFLKWSDYAFYVEWYEWFP